MDALLPAMFKDGNDGDVIIECNGGASFRAHSFVLESFSSVMADKISRIQNDMGARSQVFCIRIKTNHSIAVMKAMVRSIYWHNITAEHAETLYNESERSNWHVAMEYFAAAHEFGVKSRFADVMIEQLKSRLTTDNWWTADGCIPTDDIYDPIRNAIYAFIKDHVLTADYLRNNDPLDKVRHGCSVYNAICKMYREKIIELTSKKTDAATPAISNI